MNARERYLAVMRGELGIRTLLWEFGYWNGAVERWYTEGLRRGPYSPPMGYPEGTMLYAEVIPWPCRPDMTLFRDYDVAAAVGSDPGSTRVAVNWRHCPLFPHVVLEEDETTQLIIDSGGVKSRVRRQADSIPHFLEWPVTDWKSWEKIRDERFNLATLANRFPSKWADQAPTYRNAECPVGAIVDGFFSLPRELIGVERQLMMYYTDPKLLHGIAEHAVKLWLAIFEEILSKTKLDFVYFWEDMAFKNGPLISPQLFREFLAPYYRQMTSFLRGHGIDLLFVDTDGDCRLLIPEFLAVGIKGMYPFEVQAGMNIVEVRHNHPELCIIGGIDKRAIAAGRKAIDAELEAKLPPLLKTGRFIPTCDHNVPPDVSWEDFRYYRQRIKEIVGNSS